VPQFVFSFHNLILLLPFLANVRTRDDVRELMSLINSLRGFPSDDNKDVYGRDTKLDFATFEIQWSNQEDDPAAVGGEVAGEQKEEFGRVVESVEALARMFAKEDSAV
jgi:hypothetical protein